MRKTNQIEIPTLRAFPSWVKQFILVFIGVLSFGYGTGVVYVMKTSGASPKTLEEQYVGNENDMEAIEMKFEKSEKAMLTLVHGHVVSFALIFFALGGLMAMSSYSTGLKKILIIEPLLSTLTTFGGIWLMWYGIDWMTYVVMISGMLMHVSFATMVILLFRDLLRK